MRFQDNLTNGEKFSILFVCLIVFSLFLFLGMIIGGISWKVFIWGVS